MSVRTNIHNYTEEEEKDNLIDCFLEVHSGALITVRLKKINEGITGTDKKKN